MEAEITFYAFLNATAPGARIERPCVLTKSVVIEVPEVSGADAPVAFRIHEVGRRIDSRSTTEIRHFDGAFYQQTDMSVDALQKFFAMAPYERKGFKSQLYSRLQQEIAGAEGLHPQGAHRAIKEEMLSNKPKITDEIDDLGRRAIVSPADQEKLEKLQQEVVEAAGRYLIADGMVCVEAEEPIYTFTDRAQAIWKRNRAVSGWTSDTFSALDRDVYLERVRSAAAHAQNPNGWVGMYDYDIEVLSPDHVRWSREARDLDAFARYTFLVLDEGIFNSRARTLKGYSRPFMDSVLDLRDLLASYDRSRGDVPDELEGVLARAVAEARAQDAAHHDESRKLLLDFPDDRYAELSARWAERPVHNTGFSGLSGYRLG